MKGQSPTLCCEQVIFFTVLSKDRDTNGFWGHNLNHEAVIIVKLAAVRRADYTRPEDRDDAMFK